MYGLWWILGILALLVGMFLWLDAYSKHRRRGRRDVFAAWNLIALGAGGLLLTVAGLIAKLCGAPEATMVEVQYYLSNRLRWEVGASLRALVGCASAQTLNLALGSAFLLALGACILKLHPKVDAARSIEVPKNWRVAQTVIRFGVPVVSFAFLSNPLAKFFLGLDDAHRYIASEGFFLTANPADMWHFHSLAIYALCLTVPYFVLQYWVAASKVAKNPVTGGLKLLPPALAVSYFLIRVLTPVLGVTLYAILICLTVSVVLGCFDARATQKQRTARYTKRENEILDLLTDSLDWADQIEPAEARAMAKKMADNGDAEVIRDIYERLERRGQEG